MIITDQLIIEQSFERKKSQASGKDNSPLTEYEKILMVMRASPEKIWWFAYEVMGAHQINGQSFFISYEAGARMAELGHDKTLFESRQIGKFMARRVLRDGGFVIPEPKEKVQSDIFNP